VPGHFFKNQTGVAGHPLSFSGQRIQRITTWDKSASIITAFRDYGDVQFASDPAMINDSYPQNT
jgi:hypothetical protein